MKKFKINSVKGSSVEFYSIIEGNLFEIKNRQILIYKEGNLIASFPSRFFSIEELTQ